MNTKRLKRMRNICIIVIAMHVIVFLLLFNIWITPDIVPAFVKSESNVLLEYYDYNRPSLWDITKAYSVSISFFPKLLSAITLAILLSIRIFDFIVVFIKILSGILKGEEEYYEKKNKYRFIHILGIIVTPVWFLMISFFGFNFGRAGIFYAYINSEEIYHNIVYPLINVFLVPAIIICVLLVYLDLSILVKPINEIFAIIIMVLVYGARLLPAECDFLIYGPNIEENLIRHNEKAITTYISTNNNTLFLGDVNYIYIDEVDIEATSETVEFDGRYVSFDYTFKDNKTQKQYVMKITGKRLWFGKYHWKIVSDEEIYSTTQ